MCDGLKADMSSAESLSVSEMPADVRRALEDAARERVRMRAKIDEQQDAMHEQLEEERKATQELLEKERAATRIQLEVRRSGFSQSNDSRRKQCALRPKRVVTFCHSCVGSCCALGRGLLKRSLKWY